MAAENDLTLGEYLRQEREKRGLTIEQVASATKISVRLLHSLEADQYGELPAKPFIRGFVTSYARFVGLDPREVLTQFGDFVEKRSHDRPSREGGHSGYAFEKREGEQGSRMVLGITMGVFVLVGAVVFVVIKPSLHHHRHSPADRLRATHASAEPSPELSALPMGALPSATPSLSPSPSPVPVLAPILPPVAAVPTPSSTPRPSPSPKVTKATPSPKPPKPSPSPKPPKATPSPKPAASPSPGSEASDPLQSGVGLKASQTKQKVVIKASETTWVRYQSDSRKVMQFILKKGKVLVLRAESTIKLQIAKPENVSINVNGGGFRTPSEDKDYVMRQNGPTLFFPPQLADNTPEPFPGEKPIPGR